MRYFSERIEAKAFNNANAVGNRMALLHRGLCDCRRTSMLPLGRGDLGNMCGFARMFREHFERRFYT